MEKYYYWTIFGVSDNGWFILNRYHYPHDELDYALMEALEHQNDRFFKKHIPELVVTVVECQGNLDNRGDFK